MDRILRLSIKISIVIACICVMRTANGIVEGYNHIPTMLGANMHPLVGRREASPLLRGEPTTSWFKAQEGSISILLPIHNSKCPLLPRSTFLTHCLPRSQCSLHSSVPFHRCNHHLGLLLHLVGDMTDSIMSATATTTPVAVQTASSTTLQHRLVVAAPESSDNGSVDTMSSSNSTSLSQEGLTTPTPSTSGTQNSEETSSSNPQAKDTDSSSATQEDDINDTLAPTEQSETPDEASKDDSEAKAETEETEKTWVTDMSIDLYCKKNGQSHAVLTAFGFWGCPQCHQSLDKPDYKKPAKSEAKAPSPTETASTSNEPVEQPDFEYSLAYLDAKRYPIMSEPWDGPFDLSKARSVVIPPKKTDPVFKVETKLLTSIHGESSRPSWEVKAIKEKRILTNPSITVDVYATAVTINSEDLIRIFAKFIPYYPFGDFTGRRVAIWSPFRLFWLYHDKFTEYLSKPHSDDTKDTGRIHLQKLLGFVQSINGKEVADEKERHSKGMCTYDLIWLLYKPGTTVYVELHGQLSAFVVSSVQYNGTASKDNDGKIRAKGFTVEAWNLTFDGSFVGRHARNVWVPPFEGERKITDLNVIPSTYKDEEDEGATRRSLIEVGKKWYKLLRGGQAHYSGRLLDDWKREFNGRVYVDNAAFYNIEGDGSSVSGKNGGDASDQHQDTGNVKNPWAAALQRPPTIGAVDDDAAKGLVKCPCPECHGYRPHPPTEFPWASYDVLDPNKDLDLKLPHTAYAGDPDHRYMLCERRLFGFDLKSRNWLVLDAGCCQDAVRNEGAIDKLVMNESKKDLIKALIQKFSGPKAPAGAGSGNAWRADFIDNKGEGQIFLLHGSPGVGKTYYTGRALLSLTCADIGTDEIRMEKRLLKWFQLAEKWGAVMLIDEADVFLERRATHDLKRNSLVSVFLRCIEYYRGVLFLTTNRVGHFDDAFMSRIHVIIHYKPLDEEERRQIWQQFFDKLEAEREFDIGRHARAYVFGKDPEDSDSDAETTKTPLVSMPWNGREIRNAFQTAVALAEYRHTETLAKGQKWKDSKKTPRPPKLDSKDFIQVCKMMQDFKRYLHDVHGADEGQRAHRMNSRAPEFALDC
ncbi:hypothetical protein QBC45DRAFT_426741 [Copromyces sp. CBS 386.78]|nr:hypothetical protein QBC45DRAFT_426741 [Copromyces sp. CBS 386.78]